MEQPSIEEIAKVVAFLRGNNILLISHVLHYTYEMGAFTEISDSNIQALVLNGNNKMCADILGISEELYGLWLKAWNDPEEYFTCRGIRKNGERCKNRSPHYRMYAGSPSEIERIMDEALNYYCPHHHGQRVIRG